jgi:hypothetical protein
MNERHERAVGGLRLGGCPEHVIKSFTAAHEQLTGAVGDLGRLLDGITPKVIGVQLVQLDALGQATAQYRVPFRALSVDLEPSGLTANASAAAAGSATATLPVGAELVGFTVTEGTFTVANFATVTVTGAAGGTQTYNIQNNPGSTSAIFGIQQTFPVPLIPASPLVPIAVTFNGNANTGPVNVTAIGQPGPLVVANATLAGQAPGPGPGVAIVRPGSKAVINFRAYQWSMYGLPGQLATVAAYANPQAPG